jgi:hypothetical protein
VRAFFGQLRRYAAFAAWFYGDALRRYRVRLVLLVAANVLGVGLQGLALLAVYRYAHAVESGVVVHAAGHALDPRASLGLLAGLALTVFVLALLSAGLVMRSRVEGARVALDYAAYCRQRIYLLASRLPASADALDDYTLPRIVELARRDPDDWFRFLRTLIYALLPLGILAATGVALLLLNARLTLLVFVLFVAATWFLRRTAIRAASHRARLPQHATERAREGRLLEDRILRSPAPLAASSAFLRQTVSEGGAGKMRDTLVEQQRAVEGSKLVAQVAVACALFMVLIVQGGATLRQGGNWSALLAYVGALTLFGGAMARAARLLVTMNQFYPALARHARFVAGAELRLAGISAAPPATSHVMQARRLGAGTGDVLSLRAGERLALVLPGDADRHAMVVLARAFRPTTLPWFAGAQSLPSQGSLREHFGFPAQCSLADVQAAVSALGAGDIALPASLDQPLTDGERRTLTPAGAFVLMALSGVLNRSSILVLEHAGLALLPRTARALLLEKAETAAVLIAFNSADLTGIGGYGEPALVICAAGETLGWATVRALESRDEEVLRALAAAAADRRAPRAAAFHDDLDDME